MTNNDWYYNGEGKSEWGFNPLEDFTAEEIAKAEVFVKKFRDEAPAGFVYSVPDDNNPFGSWERENDEFGGTHVALHVAQGSDATSYDYPDGFEIWIFAGEGMQLGHVTAEWSRVDPLIKETGDLWAGETADEEN